MPDSKKRTFYLNIPAAQVPALRRLAEKSGLTLEQYASGVIEQSVQSGDLFRFVKKLRESTPALSS